MGFKSLAN